jgi:uncharacterized iron-regulated membrane protein
MRFVFALLHRWLGLGIASFLFVSGLTGAVISWDHELDDLLNAHLTTAQTAGPPIPVLELVRQVETRDPRVRVVSFPLAVEPGESLSMFVQPRVDPTTGRLHHLGYNQVFVDPPSGRELGRREWGAAWPITSENVVSFLYKLHYSLHLPEMWGIDLWGRWLLGGIALIWTIDCFIGFYLTLPARHAPNPAQPAAVQRVLQRGWWTRWRPAWRIKMSGSRYRIAFDIHRAFGLWLWALIFVLAFTAFSLNLYREIFYPLMSMVSQVTPNLFAERAAADKHEPIEPVIGYAEVVDRARSEGTRRGWDQPVGGLFYTQGFGIYGARFFRPGEDHGAAGVGPAILYFDGRDGRVLGERRPWKGTMADIFLQAQFPIHSGRILGLPGRILVSVMGLVVATLSMTGVAIWYRKRRARLAVLRHHSRQPTLAA